eukprot:gene24215-29284_t
MSFETGKIGRQANAAVVGRVQDTMVYSTVCYDRNVVPGDFTPLKVDYFSRFSAIGATTGAFHRRDSRGDDSEILVARLIDRPLRPTIKEGWGHDTQILSYLLSFDKSFGYESLAICTSAAALQISEVPTTATVAGVVVGWVNDTFLVNPPLPVLRTSPLQLYVGGTGSTGLQSGRVLMLEGGGSFIPENVILQGVDVGMQAIDTITQAIDRMKADVGKSKRMNTLHIPPASLFQDMEKNFGEKLESALFCAQKQMRGESVEIVEKEVMAYYTGGLGSVGGIAKEAEVGEEAVPIPDEDETDGIYVAEELGEDHEDRIDAEDEASELPNPLVLKDKPSSKPSLTSYLPLDIKIATKKLLIHRMKQRVLRTNTRVDGRTVEEVRPISIENGLLPGAHGSSLFTRGETQSLATATLGSKSMEAKYETVESAGAKRFYLQYRFPPSSVGEVGRVGGIGRREVGHGALAEKALVPAIPKEEDFPYCIRGESLITESSGSSSMASVCSVFMSMCDAGVPVTQRVGGVAMGLIVDDGEVDDANALILTDILGLEDALGTMDMKVAGSEDGVTAIQLDTKGDGLPLSLLSRALQQAKRGRLHILDRMIACMDRDGMGGMGKAHPSENAGIRRMKASVPRLLFFKVPPESIGKVIGSKGRTIQMLIDTHKLLAINIEDDGQVQIESDDEEKNQNAKAAIMALIAESDPPARPSRSNPPTTPLELGAIYRDCPITGVQNFGIFVALPSGGEGLVPLSELALTPSATPPPEFVKGGKVDVRYVGMNAKGQVRLSRKAVLLRDSQVKAGVESALTEASSAASPSN